MDQADRRKQPRVSVPATLTLARGPGYIGTYHLHDVSQGGARVMGRPQVVLGEEVDVLLHLPGREGLALTAKVVHLILPPKGAPAVGLRFEHTSEKSEESLLQAIMEVLAQMEQNQDRVALVADDSDDVRHSLMRELEILGWQVVEASCLEQAKAVLKSSNSQIQLALVDLYLGNDDPLALMTHLRQSFPEVRRILISGQTRTGELHLIASAIPAHGVLTKPWDCRQLARIAMS